MNMSTAVTRVLLVAVIGLFAAGSMARTPTLEEGQQVGGGLNGCSSNILVSGQSLRRGQRLVYGNYTFQMEATCNLVLYNNTGILWQSNTSIVEGNCSLSFNRFGCLCIYDNRQMPPVPLKCFPDKNITEGNYIAVLRPDGHVATYGPRVWLAPETPQMKKNINDDEGDHIYESNQPLVPKNVLFSVRTLVDGQFLKSHDGLTKLSLLAGDFNLTHNETARWESPENTLCSGNNASIATLNDRGQLIITLELPTLTETCWETNDKQNHGEYVLAVQDDASAAIYGPKVWTVPDGKNSSEGIRMVTAEE